MDSRASEASGFRVIENQWIAMSDGCRLAARIWLPDGAESTPVPAILEYLPYRKRDGTALRDEITYPFFARHGYAGVRVDIRGNGESDGLMADEYTALEHADGVEVIEWIARQPWCSGAVGMIGHSWGGFNGLQIAALAPEPLKAIITSCSTDDRYADDIHFMGGCLNNDNTTWSQQMLAYSSRPPDPALAGDGWSEAWLARLREMPLLAANWLRHQRRDAFWEHGSVCEDYGAIKAAVLAVGGWYDCYTNTVPRLLAGLTAPAKGIIGPWEHRYPHMAKVTPNIDFLNQAVRWWDHWLKGLDNGVAEDPALRAFLMEAAPASERNGPRDGRWVAEPVWPSPGIEQQTLHLNRDGLGKTPGTDAAIEIATPMHLGLDGGNFCPGMRIDDELAGDQRPDDALSVVFDSAPLDEPLAILGAPVIELELSADKPLAFLCARLCDVAPDGASTRVSLNPLNLTHRDSHKSPEPLVPGETYRVHFKLCDAGYIFRAGHRIRLALSTSYWPMIWPSPEAATVTMHSGASRLSLPVRQLDDDETAPLMTPVPKNPVLAREVLRPETNSRTVTTEADGAVHIEILDDLGETRDPANGLEAGSTARHSYRIKPDDPLSAVTEAAWSFTLGRNNWQVHTETWTRMTADKTHFHLTARLEAYEGGELLFERDWQEAIPRDLV